MIEVIEYTRPHLTDYQLSAFFHDKRYAWVEGTAKAGKTVGLMAWFTEQAFILKNRNYFWVAPVYGQAKIAYTRTKNGLPVEARKCNETELTITLPNEHVLWFKSGEKPDNLYGEDVGAAALDEGTRMREEAWWAIRTTLTATRGKVRGIANVKGRHNWFYKMCRRAESGEPDMHYAKITAMDAVAAGILDGAEIEDARRTLPEQVFNELYCAIPSDDGGNPFGLKNISECATGLESGPAVCFGVDLAKSVDWTVIIGLNKDGHVCQYDRFQCPWTETKERIRIACGTKATLVDSTGVGDPVLEDLQRGANFGNYEGFKFSFQSKQQIMEGLSVGIQKRALRYPDGTIKSELESFEYEYTRLGVRYSAPEGVHDDCVCALALAWQLYATRGLIRPDSKLVCKSSASISARNRPGFGGRARYGKSRY